MSFLFYVFARSGGQPCVLHTQAQVLKLQVQTKNCVSDTFGCYIVSTSASLWNCHYKNNSFSLAPLPSNHGTINP